MRANAREAFRGMPCSRPFPGHRKYQDGNESGARGRRRHARRRTGLRREKANRGVDGRSGCDEECHRELLRPPHSWMVALGYSPQLSEIFFRASLSAVSSTQV
jgi:hypothetical protein